MCNHVCSKPRLKFSVEIQVAIILIIYKYEAPVVDFKKRLKDIRNRTLSS